MEVECLALKDLTSPKKSVEPEGAGGQSEHKENMCTERRLTPLKSAETTVPALLLNRKGSASDPTNTPNKRPVLAEPWTPTANLKVLISAASPDIRDREMKKVLFRPIENNKDNLTSPDAPVEEVEDSCQSEATFDEEDAEKKPSRKQKSLGLLCQKFLALYPDYPSPHSPICISLDEVATSLGVERRRIYDIVNVLESLAIVGRIAKNSYTWYGRQQLQATLVELQRRGWEQGYHLQMDLSSEARTAGQVREDDGGEGDTGNAGCNRKDKSLRIMSQKFVMLFLVSKTQTVTLDAAAKVLIEESQDSSSHSKYKTKVRRLYDIANVLTSLGLIKKVCVREEKGRKPAFKWLGPVEFSSSENTLNGAAVAPCEPEMSNQDFRKAKLARHASLNITPTSAAVQRQVSSAPSSPRCHLTGPPNQAVDYSRRTLSNVCGSGADAPLYAPLTQSSSSSAPPTQHLLIPPPHCLAYLPSLSQPSVVMLYKPPDKLEWMPEGQRSAKPESGEERKQRRDDGEEEVMKKKARSSLEDSEPSSSSSVAGPSSSLQRSTTSASDLRATFGSNGTSKSELGAEPQRKAGETSPGQQVGSESSSELTQPSHYLYVPNNAGLNSLNFLIPAGQPAAGVALPPSTVALPYVLVPSAALPHYPLMTSSVQQQGSDHPANLGFSLPAVISPAHFMVGAAPYSVGAAPYSVAAAPEVLGSPLSLPVTPEQSRRYVSRSPPGQRQTAGIRTQDPLTPHTPKETTASVSKAFFQTPGTLGGSVSSARKRGSAQRRLDVSHPAAAERDVC